MEAKHQPRVTGVGERDERFAEAVVASQPHQAAGLLQGRNAAFHLVYEFMANGSLQDHLLERKPPLSWKLRIKIAIGAARCLRFLHKSNKRIIHQDVKPSVILLDSDFNPKLSGLGWSLS
ncbi:unnamed protein product [Musa acuminata subsp. burmannicoides]